MSLRQDDSAAPQLVEKIGRKRRGDAKRFVCHGMHHLELSSVQHRTICVSLSIKPVACQRMIDRGEMDANLMCAAGLERDVEERAIARGGDRREVRDTALAVVAHAELD